MIVFHDILVLFKHQGRYAHWLAETSISSSIIFLVIYLCFGISIDFSTLCDVVPALLRGTVLIILTTILLSIKSPVASPFLNSFF